jgi:hypothetical protein
MDGCGQPPGGQLPDQIPAFPKGSYGYDRRFLQHQWPGTKELHGPGGNARLLVSPEYQGRVMTSTTAGDSGISLGWVNYDLISSQVHKSQFNPVGGEERLWFGPEGGPFGLYFAPGDSFTIAHWQVPPILDTLPFQLDSFDSASASFSQTGKLRNYSGMEFSFRVHRRIRLLSQDELERRLSLTLPTGIRWVAYESQNRLQNAGIDPWLKDKGLLSIWLLGMMIPSDRTVVMIPFRPGRESGSHITDDYFGRIPPSRLVRKDSLLYFRCDGRQRGKLGLDPEVARGIAASYDFARQILTLISFPVDLHGLYVNSKWENQKYPYRGDVINAYNDGPLANGNQLGPFYELESSSAARELPAGQWEEYTQVTAHLQGDYPSMKRLAAQLLGVDLDDVRQF